MRQYKVCTVVGARTFGRQKTYVKVKYQNKIIQLQDDRIIFVIGEICLNNYGSRKQSG